FAAADPIESPQRWSVDGATHFERSIDNVDPLVGDTIRVSTAISSSAVGDAYIYGVRDFHPACMEYVPGSARVDGNAVSPEAVVPNDPSASGMGNVLVSDQVGWRA